MKKLIYISMMILMLGFVTNSYAQEERVPTQAEQIIDKYLDKAETAIISLANTLKVPAEHVYSVLVRQHYIRGLGILIGTIVITILFIILTILASKDYYENIGLDIGSTCLGILDLALIVIFIIDGLPMLLNPEYYAIKVIMSFF